MMENIKLEAKEYKDVIDHFSVEKIVGRYNRLLNISNEFLKSMAYEKRVKINQLALCYTVMDYFCDIARIKDFHPVDFVNKIKIAAYEVSWILKRKPFQILENDRQLMDVNEHFAVFLILTFLGDEEASGIEFDEHIKYFWDTLFYYFKFREVNPQAIELALTAFCAGRDLFSKK